MSRRMQTAMSRQAKADMNWQTTRAVVEEEGAQHV
jgi:hypothetical protein